MSQRDPIHEPPPRDDDATGRAGESSDAAAGELSFDDLQFAKTARPGAAPFVHELQKRAGDAVHESAPENAPEAPPEAATAGDAETVARWSPRVQVLCIMGGSALCWAVILTPFLLF